MRTNGKTVRQQDLYIGSTEAMEMLKKKGIEVSLSSFLEWVDKNKLGKQFGGPASRWYIKRSEFEEFIEWDEEEDGNG